MPELPDVEIMKQHADATSLGKKIKHVEVRDEGVLDISPQTLRRHVENHSFEKTGRTGKRLFISITSDQWLMLHFGMTGNLSYTENGGKPPEYSKILFHFSDEALLSYTSKRKLGSLDIVENPEKFKKENQLGEDALSISRKNFVKLLGNKHSMIKTALMDQSMIAGLGNVYSDEVLYQSKVHPKTKTDAMDEKQFSNLHKNMQRILKTAINSEAKAEAMPQHYLITHRSKQADCPDCEGKVKRIKVSGRSCYICPGCQQL